MGRYCCGPGPGEKTYIYVGEIGDNAAKFDYKYIYRLEEPKLDLSSPVEVDVTTIDSIKFQLPDGKRDTEAIMVDPLTKDLYVFSKREKEEIHVYVLPFPQSTTTLVTARFVMKLAVPLP
ncbi:MAG: hypothetical protein HC859_16435 [Bacteroidia bacterium]|nr:hypothetical protein [Bacteroidia bacterium]